MPLIKKFSIKNFKGASDVVIELDSRVTSKVITLIGLNESGKTTILEALSHFVTGDTAVASLFDGVHAKAALPLLMPVHRKAAFTDEIKVTASVSLDDEDITEMQKIANSLNLELDVTRVSKELEISKSYSFVDSVHDKTNNWYGGINLYVKKLSSKSKKNIFSEYVRPDEKEQDLWLKIVFYIRDRLPSITYFPTFLVDMPSKIYLKEHSGEKPVNRYYRLVVQDVLDSLNEDLSLERHVCKRIDDFIDSEKTPNWFPLFYSSPTKAPIDSVFQKISNKVTREVLDSWQNVFQLPVSAKSVFLEWQIDTEKENIPYISFYVSDGESRYAISERSLGFRWFFSFLLFTAFKQKSTRPTLFLFDEPAANLHAKAQAELLKSFQKIVAESNKIIYSTHSHHMINPQWLSGAYIVENTAVDFDSNEIIALGARPTSVKATKYREFVGGHPNRTSYFQPVIEKLEYVSPLVIGNAPYLILEGISDYYAFSLVKMADENFSKISLMPGGGAGASGPLISLLIGRGERFLVLLDDDAEGKKSRDRYKENWGLSDNFVCTLGDLVQDLKGKSLERVLCEDSCALIKDALQISTPPSKKQIALYLAESVALGKGKDALGSDGFKKISEILSKSISVLDLS